MIIGGERKRGRRKHRESENAVLIVESISGRGGSLSNTKGAEKEG